MFRWLFVVHFVILAVGLFFGPALHACAEEAPAALSPEALFEKAVRLFFDGQPNESAKLFDDLVEARPELTPELWQRGLALYYAERFDDGRKQFEHHKAVNPNDVENPVWHYLCVARKLTPEDARQAMLPVGQDSRVQMREILALSSRGRELRKKSLRLLHGARAKRSVTSCAMPTCIWGFSPRPKGTR